MSEFESEQITTALGERYRVELLADAEVGEAGVTHGRRRSRALLPWSRVLWALAAEVGEPEGVRTVVFDLVVERSAAGCRVCRFDAGPGEDARVVAAALARCLGRDRTGTSLKRTADDGYPQHWYPDLEALAEAALETLASPTRPEATSDSDRKPWGRREKWREA
jgi:hypothetical protein